METPSHRLVAARLAVASMLVLAGMACDGSAPAETVAPIQLAPTSTASTPDEAAGAEPVDPPDAPPAGGATEEDEPEDTATAPPPTRREEPAPARDDGAGDPDDGDDDRDGGDNGDNGDDGDDSDDSDDSDG